MSNRQAKFASALFVGVFASLPLSTVFDGLARAADSCLTEPNGATPQGKHWFYRIERVTGRRCWYLRGEDEQPARAAAPETTTPAKTPSRNTELLAPDSLADTRAELPAQPPVAQDAAAQRNLKPAQDVTGTAPSNDGLQAPAVATRPDPSRAVPLLGPPPETSAAAAGNPSDATAAPPAAVAAPTAVPTDRNMGSLQKLLLVAFGALALAGLSGSAVYRLAAVRRRGLQRDRWPPRAVEEVDDDAPIPPWVQPVTSETAPSHDPGRERLEFDVADKRVERIEDFLARLTKQLETEMEAPRPERQRATN